MGTRFLVLVRHGQYEVENGGALTGIGREQARVTAQFLRQVEPDVIWSSTLVRAKETADILASRLGSRVLRSGLLREGMYSKVEGYETPAWERREDKERAEHAYRRIFRVSRANRTEIVVCHGNLIRFFVCRSLHAPVGKWLRMTTNHCGITRILIRDTGAVRVMSYNETAHLPPKLVT
jgi:serine/threonine-protein phosphatase PGAM5